MNPRLRIRLFLGFTTLLLLGLLLACGGSGGSSGSGGGANGGGGTGGTGGGGGGGTGGGTGGGGGGGGPTVTVAGITTFHGDAARTGLNASEGTLTPANVNSSQFGKLFSLPVDGQVYAQPLYMAGVKIAGGTHNVVFVATEHDSVYAFDADTAGPPLWHVSFINPAAGITPAPACQVQARVLQIVPEVGITSTPVIDPSSGAIYVLAETTESGVPTFRLHALDVTTGAERGGSPVVIQGSVAGVSPFQNNGSGQVVFSPSTDANQIQRPALLLANGNVYLAFASHADINPYHGWVFAYNASTLAQTAVFNTTPNGTGSEQGKGGIWMSGAGPAADAAGNVYVAVGNGTFSANSGGVDFGDSLLKLSGTLSVTDWFTPFNEATLQAQDKDLGAGGVLVVPDQTGGPAHLLISGSKAGGLYVVDRDNMGHFNPAGDTQIVQSLPGAIGPLFSAPGYFHGTVYFGGAGDVPKAFTLTGGKLTLSSHAPATIRWPGASPTISANGTTNGIVWMLDSSAFGQASNCSSQPAGGPAVLHAYDATDLAHELYNSTQAGSRDQPGGAIKFTVPTVANGKVYVGTQNQVTVFGLLP